MIKMTDYYIVRSFHFDDFESEIENRLRRGWYLYGNPYFAQGIHCQAMVKYEKSEDE